jgi:hypothetical protein
MTQGPVVALDREPSLLNLIACRSQITRNCTPELSTAGAAAEGICLDGIQGLRGEQRDGGCLSYQRHLLTTRKERTTCDRGEYLQLADTCRSREQGP